ncbi:MAG: PaaI family thioesterase [Rubrivivax sp.]
MTATPTAPAAPALPDSAPAVPAVPEGFVPIRIGGEFVRSNGPLYLRKVGAHAQMGFRVEPRHTNPAGICHGGMMASFCDMLLPVCAHHQVEAVARRFLPTISLQIDYLAPTPLGAWVQGEAEVLRTTASLVFIQGLVSADGVPVARTSGLFKIGPVFTQPGAPGA